jgi:ABC-2 type transport system ATP-binding protein
VLYGELEAIRRRYAGHAVLVRGDGELPAISGVELIEPHNGAMKLSLLPGTSPQDVLRSLVLQDVRLERFEIATPTLDEIFIRVVQGERRAA